MKILIITNAYPSEEKKYSGIFVKNQVEWFKDHTDFNVDLFFIKRSFTTVFGSLRKYLISYLRFLPLLMKRYDILHIHFLSPLIVLPYIYKLFHPSVNIFLTMHGSDINSLENKALIIIYRHLVKRVDTVICVGKSMRDPVAKKLDKEIDYFLCAGINTTVILPINKSYKERDIDFLYVGSFYKIKGTDILIKALYKLENQGLKVVLIGSGDYERELGKLCANTGLEVINGLDQRDVNDYYNRSKFFVFPSRSEGFGLALAEAMYCGTPGIVSNLEQLKYQVNNNRNGYVCEDFEPEKLAKVLIRAKQTSVKEWEILSENAQNGTEKFTLDYVCNSLKSIYQENGR